MTFVRSWINFRRMQDIALVAASLIYAGAVIHAYQALPGDTYLITQRTIVWPLMFAVGSAVIPLSIPVLRRYLARYVWLSYQAGFGQTVFSVLTGLGLLGLAAFFIYWQVATAAGGGRYPAGVFSGYAAGIGILLAQAVLVRALEQLPEIRKFIVQEEA